MRVYRGLEEVAAVGSSVITVGSFDGVHIAHQALLGRVCSRSSEIGAESFVVTFEPHPRIVLGKAEGLKLLTTTEEKIELLGRYGIDNLLILPFTKELSRMDYTSFIRSILIEKLSMREMVVGFNHRLGSDAGNYTSIEGMEELFTVNMIDKVEINGSKVSSTVIRTLIEAGDFNEAVELMAHPYLLHGEIVDNELIITDSYKLLPNQGIYCGCCDNEDIEVEVCGNRVKRVDGGLFTSPNIELRELLKG